MSERPIISPLRPEIANPEPAMGLEKAGIAILKTPFAIRDIANAWRRWPLPAKFTSVGTVALACLASAWMAFGTPVPQFQDQKQLAEVDRRYVQLITKEMGDDGEFGIGNITSGLQLGVDFQTLNLLGTDEVMGINKPRELGFFAYITEHNPEWESVYNASYARDHMNKDRSADLEDNIAVKSLAFDLRRYKAMYESFMLKYGLFPAPSEDVVASVGITYDWVMALRAEVLGSNAVPELTPLQFSKILERQPFKVTLPKKAQSNILEGDSEPRFSVLKYKSLSSGNGLGIGNITPELELGINSKALEQLMSSPSVGINKPSDAALFAYISDGNLDSRLLYSREYALDHMQVGTRSRYRPERIGVVYLTIDPVGAERLRSFSVSGLPTRQIDLLSVRLAADWIVAMKTEMARINNPGLNIPLSPMPITNEVVRLANAARPFNIERVDLSKFPNRG